MASARPAQAAQTHLQKDERSSSTVQVCPSWSVMMTRAESPRRHMLAREGCASRRRPHFWIATGRPGTRLLHHVVHGSLRVRVFPATRPAAAVNDSRRKPGAGHRSEGGRPVPPTTNRTQRAVWRSVPAAYARGLVFSDEDLVEGEVGSRTAQKRQFWASSTPARKFTSWGCALLVDQVVIGQLRWWTTRTSDAATGARRRKVQLAPRCAPDRSRRAWRSEVHVTKLNRMLSLYRAMRMRSPCRSAWRPEAARAPRSSPGQRMRQAGHGQRTVRRLQIARNSSPPAPPLAQAASSPPPRW